MRSWPTWRRSAGNTSARRRPGTWPDSGPGARTGAMRRRPTARCARAWPISCATCTRPVRSGKTWPASSAPALSPARPDGTLSVDGCGGPPGPGPDRPAVGDRQTRLRDDRTDRQARLAGRRPAPPGTGMVRLAGQDPGADAAQDRPAAEAAGAGRRRMGGDRLHPPRPARSRMCAGVPQAPLPVHGVRLVVVGGLPAPVLRAACRDHVPGAAVPRPALAARRPGGRDAPGRHAPAGGHGGPGSRGCHDNRRALPRLESSTCAAAPWTSKTSSTQGKEHVRERRDAARPDRHAGRRTPRRRVPVRLPRTGAAPVRRALPPGRIRRRLDRQGSRRGIPLRPPPQSLHHPPRGNRPARPGRTRPPVRLAGVGAAGADSGNKPHRPPPYVFSDKEIRRLFRVIDTQPLSENSNRALVDPVLFRVFYGAGLRLSEALGLELRDVDPARATIEVRNGKNHENRLLPVTRRLAATVESYIAAAHPCPEPATSCSTPATLPGRRTSPRFTTGSGVTSPTPASPISREARTSIRCGTASPWRTCAAGQPRRGPGGHAALPVGLHGPR